MPIVRIENHKIVYTHFNKIPRTEENWRHIVRVCVFRAFEHARFPGITRREDVIIVFGNPYESDVPVITGFFALSSALNPRVAIVEIMYDDLPSRTHDVCEALGLKVGRELRAHMPEDFGVEVLPIRYQRSTSGAITIRP